MTRCLELLLVRPILKNKLLGIVLTVLITGQMPLLSSNKQCLCTEGQETLKQQQTNLYKLSPVYTIWTNTSNDLWKINATSQSEGRQEANNIHDVLITTGFADLQNIRCPKSNLCSVSSLLPLSAGTLRIQFSHQYHQHVSNFTTKIFSSKTSTKDCYRNTCWSS